MVQTRSASGIDVPPTPHTVRSSAASRKPRNSRKSTPVATDIASKSFSDDVQSTLIASKTSPSPSPLQLPFPPKATSSSSGSWTYTPDVVTLLWMAVSLPLVAWDTGYVLLRPHSMPGGSLHWPLWTPYALYGEVDHVYGFKQWLAGNGFTAAQASLNLAETVLYLAFVYLWATRGSAATTSSSAVSKTLSGRSAAWAALLLYTASVMTLSKTVLYSSANPQGSMSISLASTTLDRTICIPLFFSGSIPNGLWLVFPSIIIYNLGRSLLAGLSGSSEVATKTE